MKFRTNTKTEKKCYRCKMWKDRSLFCKCKRNGDGLQSHCKICAKEMAAEWRAKNPEKVIEIGKRNYNNNKDARLQGTRSWRKRNPDKVLETTRVWSKNNREEINEKAKKRQKEARDNDINCRLRVNLRNRLRVAVKSGTKAGSAVSDLGCSVEYFKTYLESHFKEGMTWDNWGSGHGCWQIDHIMPLTAFDLTDRQQLLLAAHYLNMQPLNYIENMKKNDKIPYHLFQVA